MQLAFSSGFDYEGRRVELPHLMLCIYQAATLMGEQTEAVR
jgi:hypothetical protein